MVGHVGVGGATAAVVIECVAAGRVMVWVRVGVGHRYRQQGLPAAQPLVGGGARHAGTAVVVCQQGGLQQQVGAALAPRQGLALHRPSTEPHSTTYSRIE